MRLARRAGAMLAALLLALPAAARAEERILSFVSDVQVRHDGSLDVAESIDVNAEGDRIRHGIFRDFPTRYHDGRGREVKVGFDVGAVERDGKAEPYKLEPIGNGVRVRIGSADSVVPPGEHLYLIRYRTTRQLGYFGRFDELYWNATGTDWDFPIDVAEARIALPSPAGFGQRAVYTGPQGSTGHDAAVVSEEPGRIVFRTTAPLGDHEGLTVAAAWPKGVVAEPDPATRLGWWVADYGPFVLGGLGLLGLLLYYLYAWRRAGRGPAAGTIVPLFTPPDGLTPAAMRFVSRMSFDNRAFAAAIVDLGVRGRIRLVEGEKHLLSRAKTTIERTGDEADLPAPEAAMMHRLFAEDRSILMDQKNYRTFEGARGALRTALTAAYEGKLFKRNRGWALLGLALVGAAIWLPAALIAATGSSSRHPAAMPTLGLLLFVATGLLLRAGARGSTGRWVGQVFGGILALVTALLALSTIVAAMDSGRVAPLLVPLLALPFAISAFWWMAAPTREGRAAMDRIAGFKRYLSITEEQRLEILHPPERTPALFERYLPYAIALGVENHWAAGFASVLAAAAAAGQNQGMAWYVGSHDPWSDPDGFADQVGSTLASNVASASSAPGSSSGSGGGGSSGGGGGGGGW